MFAQPRAIAIDTTSNLMYITDQNNHRIQKYYLSSGTFIGAVGRTTATAGTCSGAGAESTWCTGGTFASGASDGMFANPDALVLDPSSVYVYLTDLANNRVVKVRASSGSFVGAIGNTSASTGTCPALGTTTGWCTGGTFAAAATDGAFSAPTGIAINRTLGYLFVSDAGNARVVKIQ